MLSESDVDVKSFELKSQGVRVVSAEERERMQKDKQFGGKYGRHEKMRVVKNVVVLGLAFMLHFTAFHGTANLQSSVNSEESLGTFTLASVYGSLIVSNIFLPAIVIRCVGLN